MSRPEQDELRDFPDIHSASSAAAKRHEVYAVAPIHTGGVVLRHVGPRDATLVPLSILTWNRSIPFVCLQG
jgi:hypothetical protein